jgi:uncharacterized protein YndB with AHSA1/START domain
MAIRKQAGDLRKEADGYAVTFERYFPYDTMTVWDAITNPEKLAVWFFPVTMDLRPGGKMVVQFPDGTPSNCWIMRVEPGRVFEFIWENTDGPDEKAVWELFPEGDGCKLVLNYSRLSDRYAINVPTGWHVMLDHLEAVLQGRREPFEDTQGKTPEEKALQAEYAGSWFRQFAPFRLSSGYGKVQAVNGKYDIVFERLLPHPVAKVWEAITNAEKIALWSGGASAIDLRPGGKIRLGLLMATLEGTITALVNEKLLEYTLESHNIIRWELYSADNGQCRLVFTVTGNAAEDLPGAVPGWHGYLDFLAMVLDEGKVPAFPVDGWPEISKEITEKYKTILPAV